MSPNKTGDEEADEVIYFREDLIFIVLAAIWMLAAGIIRGLASKTSWTIALIAWPIILLMGAGEILGGKIKKKIMKILPSTPTTTAPAPKNKKRELIPTRDEVPSE